MKEFISLAILDGMFVNTTMVSRSETRKHFFFMPDGRIFTPLLKPNSDHAVKTSISIELKNNA